MNLIAVGIFGPMALLAIFNPKEMLPILGGFLVAYCILLYLLNRVIGKKKP